MTGFVQMGHIYLHPTYYVLLPASIFVRTVVLYIMCVKFKKINFCQFFHFLFDVLSNYWKRIVVVVVVEGYGSSCEAPSTEGLWLHM